MIGQCSTRRPTSVVTSDPHTTGWRVVNSDLGGVGDPSVCDAERRATFSELTSLFHGLCAGTVLLGNVEDPTLIDLRRKAKSNLASTTTERTCVHGSQGDQDQQQESFGGERGSSVDGRPEELVLNLKFSCLTLHRARSGDLFTSSHFCVDKEGI